MAKKLNPRLTRALLILLPLAKAFTSRGGDIEALLARHRIPLRALTDPAILIDAATCYAAMEDMAETLGDPYFAANVAIETAKTGSPGLRDAASQAVNLGDFLSRLVVEVSSQINNVRHSIKISAEIASFETQRMLRMSRPTTQWDVVGAAFYVSVIKRGIGRAFDPKSLIVAVPTSAGLPPGFLPKQSIIRSEINGWRISFPPRWLCAPFSLDWNLAQVSRGEFAADDDGKAALSYLRGVLEDNISHQDLPLNSFAGICGMHPRKVQRILRAQGTSYSQMKDGIRQNITEDLLTKTTIPIAQIALQIGLSGPAALDRAFRRWTGKTPTSFRADAISSKGLSEAERSNPE
jgi:AraC-like DNA-binding protein